MLSTEHVAGIVERNGLSFAVDYLRGDEVPGPLAFALSDLRNAREYLRSPAHDPELAVQDWLAAVERLERILQRERG